MGWGEIASALDTIVAIASPPGNSARGLIRVSGGDAISIVSARMAGEPLECRRHIARVRLRLVLAGSEVECPALALVMPGAATFTGEETVELLLVGSTVVLSGVVDALCDSRRRASAARRANPGEFSARAYLNGRLPLDEAEGIAASIAAESDAQFAAAKRLRTGSVGVVAHRASAEVLRMLALVEAGIDFTDQEGVVAISARDLREALDAVDRTLAEVEGRSLGAESLRSLPTIALRGAPNAGKSSLFNALLGRERVIESPIPGSTRDAIIEPVDLGDGVEGLLVDLPGIEDPQGALAAQMQDLAHASLRDAAVQLLCVPADEAAPPCVDSRTLVVRTKGDLAANPHPLTTSARTGAGLKELRAAILHVLRSRESPHAHAYAGVLAERHREALAAARTALADARAIADGCVERGTVAPEPVELVAVSLRRALDSLGIVAGERTPDDILAEVFARFCIGK